MKLQGVVPACVTPFVNGRADAGAYHENVCRWLETGLHGVLVFGSTGEYVYLENDERRALLQAARGAVPSDRMLLVGCGAESTDMALRYLQEAAEDGADAALVVTPVYYTRGNADAQRYHYETLAEASPIPVLLYSVAAYTAYDLPVEVILELARHPNVAGIKDSTGELKRVALQLTADIPDFAIFSGNPDLAFAALSMGAAGSIMAFGNIIPEIMVALWKAVKANDLPGAAHLQRTISAMAGTLGRYGIPGIKAVLNYRGYIAGEPRAPLQPLAPEATTITVRAWERAMEEAGVLDWKR